MPTSSLSSREEHCQRQAFRSVWTYIKMFILAQTFCTRCTAALEAEQKYLRAPTNASSTETASSAGTVAWREPIWSRSRKGKRTGRCSKSKAIQQASGTLLPPVIADRRTTQEAKCISLMQWSFYWRRSRFQLAVYSGNSRPPLNRCS